MPDDENEEKKPNEENEEAEGKTEDTNGNNEENSEEVKPFANLDGRGVTVFGWQPDAEMKCWYDLSVKERAHGWSEEGIFQIQESLKKNVDDCYFKLATLRFVDLDDDIRYVASFDNMKGFWRLEIEDSPRAELDIQQIGDFFKSDLMVKAAKQCYNIITRAAKEFEENLRTPLEQGKLLDIDETKLAAELEAINQDLTMTNLRTCKWMAN